MFFDGQPINEVEAFIKEHYKGGTVIDFGCGAGRYVEMFPADMYTGVDGHEDNIIACKARWPERKFLVRDLETWKPKKKYDYLFSSVVFDQLENLPKDWAKTYILIEDKKYEEEFKPEISEVLFDNVRMMICNS
jgi:trans-aconitate methyltransferase